MYGGVSLDVDTVCIKPFDELVYKYSFFASIEPATNYYMIPNANCGLIATTKDNEVFKEYAVNFLRYLTDEGYRLFINTHGTKFIG